MTTLPGYWSDVCDHPDGHARVTYFPQPRIVVLYVNEVERARVEVPDTLLYLRCAANDLGDVAIIAQPGSAANQTMLGVLTYHTGYQSAAWLIPLLCYSRPAVGWDGRHFVFYTQTASSLWRRYFQQTWNSEPDRPIPVWSGGDGTTSQGVGQVVTRTAVDGSQDTIVWHDQLYRVTVLGLTMINAMSANGVMVGQGQDGGMVGAAPDGTPFLAMDFDPQEPRIAFSAKLQTWMVCSHNLVPEVGVNLLPPFPPLAPSPPVVDEEPPTSPIITFPDYRVPVVASYGRPGYCGPFKATDLRSGDFESPGNCEIIVDGTVDRGNQRVDRPFFVSLQSTQCTVEKTLGFFAPFTNDDTPENAGIVGVAEWYERHNRVAEKLRYFDGPDIPEGFIDACEPDAIIVTQSIPLDGETRTQSLDRFAANVQRINRSKRRSAIDRAFNIKYGGGSSVSFAVRLSRVLDVQEGLCDIVRDNRSIGDFWFSWGRWAVVDGLLVDCGAAYIAELRAWANVLATRFTRLP